MAKRPKSSRPRPQPASVPAAAATAPHASGRTISWRHCLAGLVTGEALLLILTNLGLALANAAFGDSADGGIVGVASLVAVIGGAFLAARWAGHHGLFQGVVVGIGFIIVGAIFQFLQEAHVVQSALASGSHSLVDLGPMSMGNLISGDMLALFGGSVGGLLARRP